MSFLDGKTQCFNGLLGGKYYLVNNITLFNLVIEEASKQRMLAVDTETNSLDWVRAEMAGVVLGWGGEFNYYIPVGHKNNVDGGRSYETQLTLEDIREPLNTLLTNPNTTKIFWNAKYDLHILRISGIEVAGVMHDGLVLSFLLDENADHSLKGLSNKILDKNCDKWEKALKAWRTAEGKRRRALYQKLLKTKTDELKKDPDAYVWAVKKADEFIASLNLPEVHKRKRTAAITACLKSLAKDAIGSHFCSINKLDQISYDFVDLETITPYACADVHYTWLLFKRFLSAVAQDQDLTRLYVNEMELCRLLFEMEHVGIKIDVKYLEELGPKLQEEIEKLRLEIYALVGYEFNVRSTSDIIKVLQESGAKLTKLTKKTQKAIEDGKTDVEKKFSVDKEVLEYLAVDNVLAYTILQYRSLEKLKSTYVDSILAKVDENKYLHGTFNQNVRTGRMSGSGPNLTNIPANDKRIRRAFISSSDEDDYILADYSQVELRITAHYSQDPALMDCYPFQGEGRDVHSLTCAEVVMGMEYDEFLKMLKDKSNHVDGLCTCYACLADFKRMISKRVNFGIIYGAGPDTIQRQVSTPTRYVSRDECKRYIDGYMLKYAEVRRWIKQTEDEVWRNGWVQNAFGRYRRFPNIRLEGNNKLKYRAFRQAVNYKIQGTAADLFKYAMTRVNREIKGTSISLRNAVHDEIQFYLKRRDRIHLPRIKQIMEDFKFTVPIIAEFSYCEKGDWASKKGIKDLEAFCAAA